MVNFEKNFFQGEWRSDFYVQSEMKRVWAAQIEILVEIDRICQENGIEYFADWGTLLGTIRHEGFIPWDDDIDISMKRADYLRFYKIAKEELSKKQLRIMSIYDDDKPRWDQPFMRVSNGSVPGEKKRMQEYHGCPYVVGIDIFPLDYLPSDQAERDVLLCLLRQMIALRGLIRVDGDKEDIKNLMEEIERNCQMTFDRDGDILIQLLRLIDKCSMLYSCDECDELVDYAFWAQDNGRRVDFNKEWFRDSIRMPFENITIPVPVDYDLVLKATYGDYMKPVKNSAGHNYPFYKEQKQALEESGLVYTGDRYIQIK